MRTILEYEFMDNKTLIDTLSRRLNTTEEAVASLIDGLCRVMGECGSELDTVSIAGFGSFEPKKRAERVALHPASGKRLLVPPKVVVAFRPSASLKQKIKEGGWKDGE